MHIEPGLLPAAKVAVANLAAVGVLAAYLPTLIKWPTLLLRTLAAALFFSIFMQLLHFPVGPSELHFVGAMPIYLIFGFIPTLFGFGLGLLLQGLLFEPADLMSLSVNTLSLAIPLIALHYTLGQRILKLNMATILKLDGAYYAGVTLMVGFWLFQGEEATALADWALFASSYLAIVALEPLVTLLLVRVIAPYAGRAPVRLFVDLPARA